MNQVGQNPHIEGAKADLQRRLQAAEADVARIKSALAALEINVGFGAIGGVGGGGGYQQGSLMNASLQEAIQRQRLGG